MKKDCIILTIPNRFWDEYPGGLAMFKRVMKQIDQGRNTWLQTISGIPKQEIEFVYLCFLGKVQCRLTPIEFRRNESHQWEGVDGMRVFNSRNWVELTGPVQWAEKEYPMKGFQGFRYTEFIF